jgi:histidinol-phosphate aminotransferase
VSFQPPIRADLVDVTPYGAPNPPVPVVLNVNENPFPPSDELCAALGTAVQRVATSLNRYPDRDARELRAALGRYLADDAGVALSADMVWVANGSNEVMHHCFAAFGGPGRAALTFDPTYSMYPEYARETFTDLIRIPRRSDFTVDIDAACAAITAQEPAIVLVASPNNPTGTHTPLAEIERLAQAADHCMVIVDEAYAEFRRPGSPSALTLLPRYPNLIVTRTMSKAFGLAGARVGYAAAQPSVVDALRVVRLPYHLSAVTQAVALTALEFTDELTGQIALLRAERDALATWLTDQGLTVTPSDANFVMFGIFEDSRGLWQALLDRGVLLRETGPPGWLRVSVGTPDENAIFRRSLYELLPAFRRDGSA